MQFESWRDGTDIKSSALEREYLDASLAARDADRVEERLRLQRDASLKRRSSNRLRALVAVLTVGVLLAGSLALVAQERGTRAGQQARIAAARELAAAAAANLRIDTERSLLLALQSVQMTRSVDGTVLPEAEEALHAALQAHRLVRTYPGYTAMFNLDGTRLLLEGSKPGQVDVRTAATGSLIVSHTVAGRDRSRYPWPEVVFSPDGTLVATTAESHHVAVYDTASGEQLWSWGNCCGASFITPDSRYLVTANDTTTFVFELDNGKEVERYPFALGLWSFSPDGVLALVTDGTWNSDLGNYVAGYIGDDTHTPIRLIGQGDVNGAGWTSDGSRAVTSSPNSLFVWDPRTGRLLFTVAPPAAGFTTLAFARDPTLMATGMSDGSALVWRLSGTGALPVLRLAGHESGILTVAFSPDGTRLVTGGTDAKVKVWDITATGGGESLSVVGSGGLDFSRDGLLIAAGGKDGHARIYDSVTGKLTIDLGARTHEVNAVGFGPDDSALVAAGPDGTVAYEVGGRVLWRLPPPQNSPPRVAISPDGTVVAIPLSDGTVSLLDARTGAKLRVLPRGSEEVNPVVLARSAVAISADNRLVAAASGYPYVYVWSIDGARKQALRHPFVEALAFSPDGIRLVTAGMSEGIGSVRVYDTEVGHLLGSLKLHSEVIALAFTPDGARIATTSVDGTLRLWDARTFEQVMVLSSDANGELEFSPDGTRLAYTAQDNVIRVLALRVDDLVRLAQSRLGRALTNEECRQYLHGNSCPASSALS